MNPFTCTAKPSHQEAPKSGPDMFTCPANFHSVREASILDRKRYLPWDKNGWKFEVDV